VHISRIHIKNFRCLKDVCFDASKTTLLIGENNAGKSAVLECINAILGQLRVSRFQTADLYTDSKDKPPEKRDPIEVELEFRPSTGTAFTKEEHEAFFKQFDFDDNGHERLRIVATYSYDATDQEFKYDAQFQKKDGPGERLTQRYTKVIPFYLSEALRDLGREMGTRGGFWGRLMERVKLSDTSRQQIEKLLADINAEMLKDKSLEAIQVKLKTMLETVMNLEKAKEGVVISPLAQETTELVRRLEIYLKAPGADIYFPMTSYGMGSQSIAVLTLFRIYVETVGLTNAFLGVEEPEAHLHPHLQRFIFRELHSLPNQVFLTTHSTFITDEAGLYEIVLLKRKGSVAVARQIPRILESGQPFLEKIEERNILNYINAENSEVFFAKCVILTEGKSEKLTLPIFAKAMKINLDQLGVSVLPVGGKNFRPFLKILSQQAFDVSCVTVCDGDAAKGLANVLESLGLVPKGSVKKALQQARLLEEVLEPKNCFVIGNVGQNENFERFLLNQGFVEVFEQAINDMDGPNSLDNYIEKRNDTLKGQGKPAEFHKLDRKIQILDYISEAKPRYAERVAELITNDGTTDDRIPAVFKKALKAAEAASLAAVSG